MITLPFFIFSIKCSKFFYSLNKEVTGQSHLIKIKKVINHMKRNNSKYLFISAPENVAWLLNIRGYDNPTSPIPSVRFLKILQFIIFS